MQACGESRAGGVFLMVVRSGVLEVGTCSNNDQALRRRSAKVYTLVPEDNQDATLHDALATPQAACVTGRNSPMACGGKAPGGMRLLGYFD